MTSAPLILASASPRRRDLLTKMGVVFEISTAAVTEWEPATAAGFSATDLALANATLKANAVAREKAGRWVLGADTVVAHENRIFGKPADLAAAREILRALSTRTHRVITGCLLISPDGSEDAVTEETAVTFQKLTDEIIERYLATVHVLDKAGAYALQEHPEMLIGRVEGSRSNVVGLPMEKLAELFRRRGLL